MHLLTVYSHIYLCSFPPDYMDYMYTSPVLFSLIHTYIHTLGTWYSAMARVHGKVLSHMLYMVVLLGATFSYCIIPFLEGEPPPPRSTPWGAYRSVSYARQYLFFIIQPSSTALSLLHSLVDRSMVVGHVPMDHTCPFMCTSHIIMTAHNLAFLQIG